MIEGVVLLFSVHLCTRTLASWYGLADHWYRIRQAWGKVLLKILFWSLVPAVFYLVLPPNYAPFVLYGYGIFIVFHVLIYWIGQYCRTVFEKNL